MSRGNIILNNPVEYHFILPKKLKKQMKIICLHRGIELAEYTRECIIKNNKNYKNLIKNVV